jgi:anaerobic C4-dicarboxylate transporter
MIWFVALFAAICLIAWFVATSMHPNNPEKRFREAMAGVLLIVAVYGIAWLFGKIFFGR